MVEHKMFLIYDDELDSFELAIPEEERTLNYEAIRSRPTPSPSPSPGCHWYKDNECTKEKWLDEWDRRGGPKQTELDGVRTTTEIPRIIPPLPEGDTKDLKVWRDYWKQHDAAIAAQAREEERNMVLDEFRRLLMSDDCPEGVSIKDCKKMHCYECIIQSLREAHP